MEKLPLRRRWHAVRVTAARALSLIVLALAASSCLLTTDRAAAPPTAPALPDPPHIAATPPAAQPQTAQPTPTTAAVPAPPTPVQTPAETLPDLLAAELPESQAAYLLPLTIRHIGADRAVVFFELEQPAAGSLLYQPALPAEAPAIAIPFSSGETRHQITLDGLTLDTEYRLVVGLEDAQGELRQPVFLGESWGSIRFKTLSAQAPLRVGVIGDASFGDPATQALVAQMANWELDFVLHTGDVVAQIQENNGPVEAYALKYYQTLAPLLHRLPVYTVPGNHDYDPPARWQDSYFYYYAFPPFSDPLFGAAPQPGKNQYYAFASHGIQFLFLDSQVIFGVEGRAEQQAWLAERLADPRFRYTIPIYHVSAFYSGSVHPEDQIPVRQSWHPLFSAAGVPLALSGHSHHYERLLVDGVSYIVSGGGSSILYAPGELLPHSQLFARRTHFVLLEIHPDRIDLSAFDKDGELFDQATIPLP